MALKPIIEHLENISRLVKSSSDTKKISEAISLANAAVQKSKSGISNGQLAMLGQLETELSTWQSKLDIILKEPVGRQGMTKHAQHWAEKLTKLSE